LEMECFQLDTEHFQLEMEYFYADADAYSYDMEASLPISNEKRTANKTEKRERRTDLFACFRVFRG
jgi:hypothetical protein